VIHLDSVDEITKEKLCRTFQQFILQVLKELKYYLPFNDNILSRISTLDPFFSTMDDWTILAKSFKNIIQPEIFHKFYDEASNWIMDINKLKAHRNLYITPQNFNAVEFYRDPFISTNFPLIAKLSKALLSLPHSSAGVERVFSKLKLIKNERRNCLNNDTLESLLICKVNGIDFSASKQNVVNSVTSEKSAKLKRKLSTISAKVETNQPNQIDVDNRSDNGMEILENEEPLENTRGGKNIDHSQEFFFT